MGSEEGQSCTCDAVVCHGPALLAADFQYQFEELSTDSKAAKRRRSEEAGTVLQLVLRLVTRLKGDAPVVLDFAAEAEELELDQDVLQERVAWLVDHRRSSRLKSAGVGKAWVGATLCWGNG
ncbi:hypothetical protein OG978_07075 [Streptomyces sp. NBC_01591]|uniref:hypothetical protein n=1 Tax=Streptomyces sp. NBC_01591 TaxID=2975888 RepID=UPI002DDC296A|nr:hypothetical protein [Streptomyces sp. NBC_01591]WSD67165.1 hypothetical protein OG978_07075 [Streptomyces sp. NBC_01591]